MPDTLIPTHLPVLPKGVVRTSFLRQPTTTSLMVAEVFEKRHDRVLRRVAGILNEAPADFTGPNFGVSEYKDATGRKLKCYRLTKDGFVLLAMGFTGPKAMAFKLAYILEFNRMAEELRRKHAVKITFPRDPLAGTRQRFRSIWPYRFPVREVRPLDANLPCNYQLSGLLATLERDGHDVSGPLAELAALHRVLWHMQQATLAARQPHA